MEERLLGTVDLYPRLWHPKSGRFGKHFIGLVENEILGEYDMRAVCTRHVDCTWNRKSSKRPLCALWAWLSDADDRMTKMHHKLFKPSFQARKAVRAELLNLPAAAPWLEAERWHAEPPPYPEWVPARCPQ